MIDELDKQIIAAMQGDLPLVPEPYKEIAERIGITEFELLNRLRGYITARQLRKMGAVLKHREIGYAANALCAWMVPTDRLSDVGKLMAGYKAVTHCYARSPQPNWQYNFYTMIHAHTQLECQEIARELAQISEVDKYILLFSTREWKKTSMSYFPQYSIGSDANGR